MLQDRALVTSVFAASAALAGLLLVFLGIVISSYQSFPGTTPAAVTARFRSAGRWILAAFFLALATVGLALAWLLHPADALRVVAAALFIAEICAVAAVAAAVTWSVLLRR